MLEPLPTAAPDTPGAPARPRAPAGAAEPPAGPPPAATMREIGGPTGPEPTRYGDWEKNGRCIDF